MVWSSSPTTQIRAGAGEGEDQALLERVHVLVLIDDDVLQARADAREQGRVALEREHGPLHEGGVV
jgi:hypothetical protein